MELNARNYIMFDVQDHNSILSDLSISRFAMERSQADEIRAKDVQMRLPYVALGIGSTDRRLKCLWSFYSYVPIW